MGKAKHSSSKRWLAEHSNDIYVKRARLDGFRARSVYKLMEIDKRYRLLKPGMIIVDLGAAPGGWSEYAAKALGATGKIYALDLLSIRPILGVEIIQGDFTEKNIVANLYEKLQGKLIDVVLSDMAPNFSGIKECDQMRAIDLAERALLFANQVLSKQGTFLVKTFQGVGFPGFLQTLRKTFATVKTIKPDASRARSSEVFLLARK